MRYFLMHLLSRLRSNIPYFAAVLGGCTGALLAMATNIQVEAAVIGLAVVGFTVGMFVKRCIPNPENRAI